MSGYVKGSGMAESYSIDGLEEVQQEVQLVLELESVDEMQGTRPGQEHGNGIARHCFHVRAAQILVPPTRACACARPLAGACRCRSTLSSCTPSIANPWLVRSRPRSNACLPRAIWGACLPVAGLPWPLPYAQPCCRRPCLPPRPASQPHMLLSWPVSHCCRLS